MLSCNFKFYSQRATIITIIMKLWDFTIVYLNLLNSKYCEMMIFDFYLCIYVRELMVSSLEKSITFTSVQLFEVESD